MKRSANNNVFMLLFLCSLSIHHLSPSESSSIPVKYDGFRYPGGTGGDLDSTILVEAFFDPLCPDCKDAWPPLEKALQHYSPHVSLILHPFPLPYHDNAFLACRALHIASKLNASATYNLLQSFFDFQERYYNSMTNRMSKASITNDMAKFAASSIGESLLPMFQSGFKDSNTDSATRTSFKYGCLRGLTGTPYFLVNGFPLPGVGSALDYEEWKAIIDPLLEKKLGRSDESIFDF